MVCCEKDMQLVSNYDSRYLFYIIFVFKLAFCIACVHVVLGKSL